MTAPQLAPGTVLSGRSYNFSVQTLLGHAGSSATFRALSSSGGEAVVKLYDPAVRQRPDITSAMERVYAETMQLPGDVIVHVLEAGYDPTSGAPFSATAFVPLPSIAQLVARRPLAVAEVSGMLKAMARGLDAGHIRQVFHHAIKPTNVFLGGAPNFEARITDFGAGLVRLAVPTHDGYAQSAPWMAPEQVQQGAQAGAAADIFSTALVAFYALTGRSFWRSCQGQTPDLNAWQQELFGGRAVASLRASEIGIPLNAALDPVFSRALSVDPAQRYRTIGELAAAFDSAMTQQQGVGATMAFPAIDLAPAPPAAPAQSAYNPPPAAPTQVSPQGGQSWGSGAQPAMSGPTLPSASAQEPVPANPVTSAAAMTMVPMAAEGPRARARASKTVPIFLGVTAAVLIGGAIAAFAFLGKDDGSGSAASGSGTAITVPTPPATPAVTETPVPSTPAPTTSSAAVEAPAPEVLIKVACVPGCDSVQIDGKGVEEITKPAKVTAGKHTLTASKEGYTPFEETIEVEITDKTGKVTFSKDGKQTQVDAVKDLTKPVDHKLALAKEAAPKNTAAPTTTGSAAPTNTGTKTGTGTGTGTKKPPCKSKFGVGCK